MQKPLFLSSRTIISVSGADAEAFLRRGFGDSITRADAAMARARLAPEPEKRELLARYGSMFGLITSYEKKEEKKEASCTVPKVESKDKIFDKFYHEEASQNEISKINEENKISNFQIEEIFIKPKRTDIFNIKLELLWKEE